MAENMARRRTIPERGMGPNAGQSHIERGTALPGDRGVLDDRVSTSDYKG